MLHDNANNHLTILEVSRLIGVSVHTLRYWEKVFPGILIPMRTEGGQRRYDKKSLAIVKEIFQLVRIEGYSIRGAKRKLLQYDEVDRI